MWFGFLVFVTIALVSGGIGALAGAAAFHAVGLHPLPGVLIGMIVVESAALSYALTPP